MQTKILAIVGIVVLLASIAYAINLGVVLQNVSAALGADNVSVPIKLNNTQPVAVFEFIVNHTSNIDFKGVEATSRMPNATIEWNKLSATQVKIAAFVPNNITAGTGAIMNLKFDVFLLAIPGTYDVKVGNELFANLNETLPIDLTNGQFTITVL